MENASGFEWDSSNLNKNYLKHSVSYLEAEHVFADKRTDYYEDTKHSENEQRFLALGVSGKNRKLAVIFTVRDDKIRVISARDQSKKERKYYEKNKDTSKI